MNNKITLKEFFSSYDFNDPFPSYIHCKTIQQARKICKEFNKLGKHYRYNNETYSAKGWNIEWAFSNKGTLCIDFTFMKSINHYKKIYEFEDVIFEEGTFNLNFENALYVKNVKIISGNNRLTEKTDKGYRIKFDGVHSEAEITQMIIERFGMLEDAVLEENNEA